MGQGAHQFAGLSAPVAAFHEAYFAPGRITAGYDTVLQEARFDGTNTFHCTISAPYRAGRTGLVVVMAGPGSYRVEVGAETRMIESTGGWLNIACDLDERQTSLRITPAYDQRSGPVRRRMDA
jgi:hypothetical protein